MQTRYQSFIESVVNIAVGMFINVTVQLAIFPLFGFQVTVGESASIAVIFTFVSLIRSYSLRRFFNWYHRRE